jgi:hypothetical protein
LALFSAVVNGAEEQRDIMWEEEQRDIVWEVEQRDIPMV